jgi:2',3'-cyclic-nucleotide 2'-phosphodiesterase (5'-nucleotidase family)
LARRATFVKWERRNAANILLLDAGDTLFSEQVLAKKTKGKVIVEAMNLLGYDAMTIGDQDLRLGIETLRKRMSEANFPFLSANVVVVETGKLLAQPYTIVELGRRKVGIIGLTSSEAGREEIEFLEPIETARRYVAALSKETNFIIVLSHLGEDMDKKLAAEVSGIDLIVGGHSKKTSVLQHGKTGAIIARAGHYGKWIGVIRLHINSYGEVTDYEGKAVLLTPDFPDDEEMQSFLQSYLFQPE